MKLGPWLIVLTLHSRLQGALLRFPRWCLLASIVPLGAGEPVLSAYEAECRMQGDRIILRGTRPQDVVQLKTDGTLQGADAGTLTKTESRRRFLTGAQAVSDKQEDTI